MAIYEILVRSMYFNQVCINRWNYISDAVPAEISGSFALGRAFGLIGTVTDPNPFDAMKDICVVANKFIDFQIANLYDPTDFYVGGWATEQPGTQGGEGMAPFIGIGYRTSRSRADIHRGTKRFVGVPENQVLEGGVLSTTFRSGPVLTLAVLMSNVLEYIGTFTTTQFSPAVLSREEYTTPSGKRAYRKYADPAVQAEHAMLGFQWESYPQVRSQTSRQYGRGV